MKGCFRSCLGTLTAVLLGALLGLALLFFLTLARARTWNGPAPTISLPLPDGGPEAAASAAPPPTASPTPAYAPVSWKALVSFITADHTNWQDYEPDQYVCLNFAIDLVNNAHQAEIPAWVVAVFFENEAIGHALVAFQTTDRGLVYIEPQTDIPYIQLQVGRPLCDLWTGQNCLGVIENIQYLSCQPDGRCLEIAPPTAP